MGIEPDTKNWTWVLERPCPECGFDVTTITREGVAARTAANAAEWPVILAAPGAATRTRHDRWSPLEYACHVRDVLRLYDHRLERMLTEDHPQFANWDQDVTAIEDRYGEQDPATVGRETLTAGTALAARFAGVAGDAWQRRGTRSDGVEFTVETFALYFVHDPIHHLWDVTGRRAG